MKFFVVILFVAGIIFSNTTMGQIKKDALKKEQLNTAPFTEGILYTRVSFPGNIMNDLLSKIDFEKDNVPEQLKQLQLTTGSNEYADRTEAKLKTMTEEERTAMGAMMMGIMMSPLYAKIYCSPDKVFAKASALSYSMESLMNTGDGIGKIIVSANDKSSEAAIKFTAANMRNVWEKEEIDAERYQMKQLADQEIIAGYVCNKITYTIKQQATGKSTLGRPAYHLIVWYSPLVSQNINFLHPFYFQLDKGILKIEVHYDKNGKNRMVYEVINIQSKSLAAKDFMVSDVKPVIDWDAHPEQASMNILSVMMSSMGKQ